MTCGTCRHDNELNAKFCSECGAGLALCCSECGAEQLAGSKFCNQCGSPLTEAPAAPAQPTASPPADSAVRKQVTALFADLVGATSFGERVDPEAARAALSPYFEILRSAIEDHAGTVLKFTGDGVMAMFGLPEVAEDDALRAVAAGRELQQRFLAFAERVREQHGVELGLRVGINTGELVIGDDDADMVGDVLNTAARLEAACSAGQVLVGEDTWRLTRSVVAYEVLGEVRVKGKGDALSTFQVSSVDLQRPEESTPFVGRTDELTLLIEAFDDAVSSSAARLVTVVGAPGVGKTRLAAEMRAAVDVRSFDLLFERRGSTTFTPIVELLRELTGSRDPDDIVRLVGEHAEADRLATVLSTFVGHGEVRSTEESFWAVRRLLEHVAADGPIVVVVDDIQWAEPLFWDLLDHLVEWTTAPVMLVALARPELRELRPELTQIGRRVYASVSLEGLDAAATRELAARLLDADELPNDLIDRLPASTEGNPLFVRELVQMLVDDGVLARTGGRWHLTIDVEAIEVPPTILSLLASRVERLPDDERQVVELASVIGTEFDRGLLGSIAGPDVAGRLGALVDRLRRKDLIEPSGTWAGDHPVYRFHHVLVRDAAYRRLLKGHRAELHERVGRYLDERGEPGHELDVTVAHHYEQVHRYRSDLGTVDAATSELGEQAMRRLRAAAEQALGREDLAAAGGYAQRALALVSDDDVRQELLLVGCEAFLSSGNVATGGDLVEQLAAQRGDERLAAWTDCFQAQLWSLTDADRLDEASALADGAATRLLGLGDQAGVAKARLVRALTLARLGRVGDCEAELDLALSAARAAGDRRRTVAVLGAAPLAALWGPSPVARAGGRCLDVLRLLRITTSSPAVEATSIRCQGVLEALRGRFESARDKLESSRTTARDLGLRQGLYETELFAGFVELWAGDPGAAEPHLRLAADGLGALGIGADAGQAKALLARALLLTGRVDEAEPLAEMARESAGQNLQTAIASRAVLAEIRAAQARHHEAEQYAGEAIEIAERTDVTIDHALALEAACRTALQAGDRDAATRFERAAQSLFDDKRVSRPATGSSTATMDTVSTDRPDPDDGCTTEGLPENAAWRVNEELFTTWTAGDRDAYFALLAPDFHAQIHELGPRHAPSGDRHSTADVMFGALADDRALAVPNRLVAVRGDNLALIAMTFRDGDSTTTMYTLSEVRDGRAARADTFAQDQLHEALAELDRRWIVLGAPTDALEGLIAIGLAIATGDWQGLRDLLAADFEATVRSRMAIPDRQSADAYTEWVRQMSVDGGGVSFVLADIPAITERFAMTRMHIDAADGSRWRTWLVWTWDDGRASRVDPYDIDDGDAARARFDELSSGGSTADSELVNDETRLGDDYNRVWLRGDIDDEQFLEPDYESVSRRSSAAAVHGGREIFADLRDFWRSAGAQSLRDEVMAIRGDGLALHRFTARMETGDEISVLTIGHLGPSGRWSRHVYFDVVQLEEAQVELDRMYLSTLGYPDKHFLFRILASAYSTDFDVMAPQLHPDFEYVEHRPLTWTGGDGETLRTIRSSADHHVAIMNPQIYRMSEHGAVCRRIEVAMDSLGETEFIAVVAFHDGLMIRLDFYPCDDLDVALARYDELVAKADGVVAPPTVTNAAWEWAAAALRLLESGEEGVVDRIGFHDDFRATPAERLTVGVPDLDADELVRMVSEFIHAGELTSSRHEAVAVRGDDLCLTRSDYWFGDDLIARYTVVECRDGLISGVVFYEDTQLDDALDMLGRRWVERSGPAHLVELDREMREAQRSGDADLLRQHLLPHWTFHDRRRLGVGAMNREEFISSSLPHGGGVTFVIAEYLESTDAAVCARNRFVSPDGSEWEQLAVSTYERGRTLTTDLFDLDDIAAAKARFHELTSTARRAESIWRTPIRDSMRNRAVEVLEQAAWDAVTASTGLGDQAQRLADSFTFAGRRHSAPHLDAGAEHLVSTHPMWNEMRLVEDASEVVAVRGDDLALVRRGLSGDEGELEFLAVIETGDDRLIHTWTVFDADQLVDAQVELDRRWADQIGLSASHWIRRHPAAPYSVDPSEMLPSFHPDIEYLEHRKLSFEDGGMSELVTATSTMDLVDHVVIPIIHRLSEHASLYEQHMFDADGNTSVVLALATWLDGLVRTFEAFDLDDFERALARYDELAAASPPVELDEVTTTPTGTFTSSRSTTAAPNAASEVFDRSARAFAVGATENHMEFLHDEFTFEVRRTGALQYVGGQPEWLDTLRFWLGDGNLGRVANTLIATRGDQLFMGRTTFISGGGDEWTFVHVTRIADGKLRSSITYGDEQIEEAVDELDRQWVELGGSAWVVETSRRGRDAMLDPDRNRALELFDPDLVSIDHRQLGFGVRDLDGWLGSMEALGPGISIFASEFIVHGSSAILARTMMTAPDGESTWEFLQILMRGGPGVDRIVHQEMFDLDQLDVARARFDELQAQAGPRDAVPTELPPLVNDEVRLAKRLNAEWLAGGDVDINDYAEPDFVFAGRRRSTPPIDGGPEILRSLLDYWSEVGVIDSTIRTIAIRDRHLSLSEQILITEGGDELATIALGEIGPSGRWQRMTFFDPEQLHEALDLLEEWWLESGAPKAFARAGLALRHCFRLASPTMLRSVLSDDFRRIDHRPLGTGTCSADEMAATLEPLSEIGGVDAVISQYLECTERVSLSRTDFLASDGSMWNILSVSVIEAELLSHLEIFDANQLDHALELFHRLVGGADRESTS